MLLCHVNTTESRLFDQKSAFIVPSVMDDMRVVGYLSLDIDG